MTDENLQKTEDTSQESEASTNQPINELTKEQEYLAGWKRALADYDNLKKESDNKSKEWMEMGMMQLLSRIVPVYSNFKQAVTFIPADQQKVPWVTGIMYILQNMTDALAEVGIVPIQTVGQKVNDEQHEVLSEEEGEGESGIIVKELAPGFMKDGRVLIHAKVIVRK